MSQSQIDICLNCTKTFCVGNCKLIQDEINIWCIKKTRTLKNGEIKESYIHYIKGKTVYSRTDVIDTYIFRTMRVIGDMGLSSAVGFMQSVVGCILVIVTNGIVSKIDSEKSLF